MKTPPAPAKPGETPKPEHSYILGVGQREGDIEVLEIDDKAGSVKVNNAGIVVMLTFEKDGPKLPATPLPAVPGIPIPGLPAPTGAAPASAGQTGLNPGFTMPTRIPRVPGAAAGAETASVTPGTSSMSAAQQAAAQRTPEESALLYEANRLKNEQLMQQGLRLPRLPQHPMVGGLNQQTPVPQPTPQLPTLPFAPGIQQAPPPQ